MTKEETRVKLSESSKAELIELIFTLNEDVLRLKKLIKTDND